MKTVFVIGSGTMGSGIAQVAAQSNFSVILHDISLDLAERGVQSVARTLERMAEKGLMDKSACADVLARIQTSASLENAAKADLVIEAIVENPDIKHALYRELDAVVSPSCLLASNTSSLSITALAAATRHPDRVVGMHFFNPAQRMALVELIRGALTSDATCTTVQEYAVAMGKTVIMVNESPGFVVNRLLIPMVNEAALLLQEGAACAEDIDKAMRLGANHPLGPLALGDLVGLDVCLAIMERLHSELGEDKYRPAPLIRKLVRAGKLGRKSGAGFFTYKGISHE